MSYIGNAPPKLAQYGVESFNGGGTSFTLSKPATTATVLVFIDGVRQTPGDAYSVSGTTLTTTATTPSGTDNVTVQFLGDVVDFGEPSDDSVTSAKIADNAVGNSEMADDAVGVAELSATGTASSSTYLRGDNSWASISEYDDSGLQNDIAILGFKVAANGSLGKYDLVDQTIDDFQDASGIDASTSTGETRNASNYYSAVSSSSDAAAWVFGASASGASYGTTIHGGGNGIRTDKPFDSTASQAQSACYYNDSSLSTKWVGKDAGDGVTQTCSNWSARGSNDYGWNNTSNGSCTIALESSDDNVSWTEEATGSTSSVPGTIGGSITETSGHRYWRVKFKSGTGDMRCADFSLYGVKSTATYNSSMSLVSNSTTAQATPTTGDIVMTYTDGSGTATVGTDLKAYISRDNGTTWTQATLSSEGATGGHTILAAHNVDISSQPSGTSMRYKIETLNQSASKETRIQAVSLGWS